MNRRDMLKTAGSAAAISVLGGIPLNLSAKDKVSRRNRKKIMVIGAQTQMFHPTDFVDITTTRERKHQACYCHASQKLQSVMASTTSSFTIGCSSSLSLTDSLNNGRYFQSCI